MRVAAGMVQMPAAQTTFDFQVKREDTPTATEELCSFCFKVLLAKLQGTPLPSLSSQRVCWDAQDLQKQVPGLFVGWHTPQGLRGCMGTLQPIELHRGLSDYALTSALYDLRFSPITLKEVKTLTCRVSILHSFEPCSDPLDWKLGSHGVTMAFSAAFCSFCPCSTCKYTATLLPEVILEEGMSQEAVLEKLVRKAGYRKQCSPKMMRSLVHHVRSGFSELCLETGGCQLTGGQCADP